MKFKDIATTINEQGPKMKDAKKSQAKANALPFSGQINFIKKDMDDAKSIYAGTLKQLKQAKTDKEAISALKGLKTLLRDKYMWNITQLINELK